MSLLDVYLHADRVGTLERLDQGRIRFAYDEAWVERGGRPISLSLPVREEPYADDAARPFFAGLLPEGEFLRTLARNFAVSAGNAFTLLREIAGECAGAVSLTAAGTPPPARREPQWLEGDLLDHLIADLPERPLTFEDDGTDEVLRLSLAGAQEKLPVMFADDRVGITRGNPPSTHIIKLPDGRFDGLVANEHFCLRLAAAAGLDAARTSPRATAVTGAEFLLVERYDRDASDEPIRRLHQEDFCQALGFVPELKYQSDGGPDAAACAGLIRRESSVPARDLAAFGDALIFNWIIGNHDAHSKNYSYVLEGDNAPRMAPLYDLVSTTAYAYSRLSRRLAMKVGGENRPEYVRGRHLDRLAGDLGARPQSFRGRCRALAERALAALEPARGEMDPRFAGHPVLDRIDEQVRRGAGQVIDAADEPV